VKIDIQLFGFSSIPNKIESDVPFVVILAICFSLFVIPAQAGIHRRQLH